MVVLMKKFGFGLAVAIPTIAAAHAADLPTNKELPRPPPVDCFSSFWTYLEFKPPPTAP